MNLLEEIKTLSSPVSVEIRHRWREWKGLLVERTRPEWGAAAAKSLQSCPTLCDPKDGSPPGSPVPGILQARTLEWVAISFSNAWKWKVKVKSLSRVWLLSNAMDCSPPGSSVHGIFQARVLEWGAIAFSRVGTNLVLIEFPFKVGGRRLIGYSESWWTLA